LSTGPLLADDPDAGAARQAHHQQAEADLDQLPFDVAAAEPSAPLLRSLRRSCRKVHARA